MSSPASCRAVDEFDDLILGAGMAGLSVAALLANAGRRVLVVEAHDVPGGYAHTFAVGQFRFCAQVHYIFGCGEGETIHRVLSKLGARSKVPFTRLDPEGFDHIVIDGERFRIPNGLPKSRERLIRRFPEWRAPILRYFEIVTQVADELDRTDDLPDRLTPWVVLRAAHWYRHLLRYARSTLEDVYESIGAPPHPAEPHSTTANGTTSEEGEIASFMGCLQRMTGAARSASMRRRYQVATRSTERRAGGPFEGFFRGAHVGTRRICERAIQQEQGHRDRLSGRGPASSAAASGIQLVQNRSAADAKADSPACGARATLPAWKSSSPTSSSSSS